MKKRKKIISTLIAFLLVIAFVSTSSLQPLAAGVSVVATGWIDAYAKLVDPQYDEVVYNGNDATPPSPLVIPGGKTLVINGNVNIVNEFENNGVLIVNGKISLEGLGSNKNNGIIINNGTIGIISQPMIGTNSTQYAVTFDENYAGGTPDTVSLYAASMGVAMPANPTRTGYTFMGWNTAADGSGTPFDSTTLLSTLGSASPTVYAQWGSQERDITGFTLPNQVGSSTISGTNIGVTVPYGTDLTTLVPIIALSTNATVSPASDTPTNFTNPVTYTVTAEDKATNQTYTVTVTVGVQPTYAVTVANGTGGGSYPQGATVIITANTPPTGQMFDSWTSSDVTFANEKMASTRFVMPASGVSVTATYKAIPIVLEKHTITLGASGDGTVSGGGSYDENTNIDVIAKPNAGSSFVNWTENGVEVSTGASYTFTVTTDRTLIANFKAGDVPEPKPTPSPSYSGGSSDSSVGSTKADTSSNLRPVVTARPFTIADATKLFNAALAAKPEGQTTLSIKARNYTSADKAVLAELAALAEKNSVTLTVHFDTVEGKVVTYRISVNPALVTTNLDLTIKIVGGKLTMPKFPVPVEVAVKIPEELTIENLKITQNGKDITDTAKPWLDKNGYLHFTTTGGEIVLGK